MSIQQRIEKLQAELDALKAEASAPKKFELWVPKEDGEYFHPHLNGSGYVEANHHMHYDKEIIRRGHAFQSEADAAEVGAYLAVIGKRLNILKQFPDQDFRPFMTKEESELYDQVVKKLT